MIGRNSGIEPNSSWLQLCYTVSSYLFFLHTPPHLRINLQGMFCSQYSIDRPLSTPLPFLLGPTAADSSTETYKVQHFFLFHETGFGLYCFACVQLVRVCSSVDRLQDSITLQNKVVLCTACLNIYKLSIFTAWCICVSVNSEFSTHSINP